jgi:hypothetical protein
MSTFAILEWDMAINSIDELVIEHKESLIEDDISSLIAAKAEYSKKEWISNIEPTFIVDPFHTNIEATGSQENIDILESSIALSDSIFITGEKNKKIQLNRPAKKEKKLPGIRGIIGVNIITGTTISSPSGDMIDPNSIDISTASDVIQKKWNEYNAKKNKRVKKVNSKKWVEEEIHTTEVFEFGIPGKHLIFSSPVAISIETPNYSDGNVIDIAVLHEWDNTFNTTGLSVNKNTLCNNDGSATINGSQAIVKNGKITFYTCGASSFTMNPSGGTTGSNDLRIIIGDCAQAQIYYNNLSQVYTGVPPNTGCSTNSNMDAWPVLRIGTVSYGNDFTAWSTNTTTGSTIGNTYTATSTMTIVNGGRTYTLIIDWSHTAPNKYLTWSYRVIIPAGNTLPVKFYYGMDSAVAGADADDVGYYTSTGGKTVGIYDSTANIVSAFRYVSGPAWSGYQANAWNTVRAQIANGANFTNAIQATGGDLGFGVNWDFWTTPATYSGSVEWRLLPYVAGNVVDLIPGIGQPEWPLTTGYLSQLPITLTNAGNLTSSGVHTVVLTLPVTISWPVSSFTNNGWSCGAQIAATVTCTKTTTIASLASDTVRIPVIPLSAAGGTSVTFNVSISNPGDSNTSNNTAFAIIAVVTSTLTYAPGGVTGMTYWTKANGPKNCSTAGCTITTWSNSGTLGTAANAVIGLGTVTYDPTNSINYNPTLYFNNAYLNTNSNLSITTAATSIFTMTRLQSGGIFRIGTQTAINNALDWSTLPTADRFWLYNGTVMYNGANGRWTTTSDITTTIRAIGGTAINRTNGLQTLTNVATITPFAWSNIGIGRTIATNSALANVGEVIIYATGLTAVDRNKVESYLAIKYGTTLNQSTPQNYTLSDNSIVWNGSIAGLYNKNIAGIARDDISSLDQPKSQSISNTWDIIVNSTSAIGMNYQSLIWANDGTTTSSFSTTDTRTGYQRINREWQFQEKNGDIGNVKITYPASFLPLGAGNPIYLMMDSDGIFATGSTVYTGTLSAGNWEFTVNIDDMQYITFAQAGDTVPPIINSISRASGSLMPIGNFPIIIGYSDTGSLINPASFTGRIYSWDGIGAWNITNLAPTYMSLTGAPTTATGVLAVANLPFGKYRFDYSIADNDGNITTQSSIYFIDALEWSISSDQYDIGTVIPNIETFGSGDMVVTVKTIWAWFVIKMTWSNTLAKWPDLVGYWNGVEWWGYDSGWSILASIASSVIIGSQAVSINPNGLKNTYTYSIKYGWKMTAEMVAGFYDGNIKMDLIANY